MISVKPTDVLREEKLVVSVDHRLTEHVRMLITIKGHYLGQMRMKSPKR